MALPLVAAFARMGAGLGVRSALGKTATKASQGYALDVILSIGGDDLEASDAEWIQQQNQKYFEQLMRSLWNYTPVRSGKARASWTLTTDPSSVSELADGFYGYPSMPKIPKTDVVYLINKTSYIWYLDQGTIYAPPLFIVDRATHDAENIR